MRHRGSLIVFISFESFFYEPGANESVYFGPVQRQGKCVFLVPSMATPARNQGDAGRGDHGRDRVQGAQTVFTGEDLNRVAFKHQVKPVNPIRVMVEQICHQVRHAAVGIPFVA